MLKKVELGNRFEIFGIGEADKEDDEIGEVVEDEEEVVITIDSGAAKSVWPRRLWDGSRNCRRRMGRR